MRKTCLLLVAVCCACLIMPACTKPQTDTAGGTGESAGLKPAPFKDGDGVEMVGAIAFKKGWRIKTEKQGWVHITGRIQGLSRQDHHDRLARVVGCWRAPDMSHEDLPEADQGADPRLRWHIEVESVEVLPADPAQDR